MAWSWHVALALILATLAESASIQEDCPESAGEVCKAAHQFCCASLGNQCCSEDDYYNQFPALSMSEAQPLSVVKSVMKLVGIAVGLVVVTIVACVVCCICCPFCLFHKSRKGAVIQRNEGGQAPNPNPQEQQPTGYPQYPQYSPMPPNTGQQGYPGQGYPDYPPPYPGPPAEAPPLPTKDDYARQPAYNPQAP